MKQIAVAAGVIYNSDGKILIAKRADNQHQGGLWEFPGGKIEAGETAEAALKRELREELAIEVSAAEPLIRIHHHYPDKSVLLDVWRVTAFTGEARGVEGQPLQWVSPQELDNFDFPAANVPIVDAAQLPQAIAVIDNISDIEQLERKAQLAAKQGFSWVMLRAPHATSTSHSLEADLRRAIKHATPLLGPDTQLVLNTNVPLANKLGADALFLTAAHLLNMHSREEFSGRWLGAACHDAGELQLALDKGVQFASLSPVLPSRGASKNTLGWENFHTLAETAKIPLYARGGLSLHHIERALAEGGQGIMQTIRANA